MRFYKSKGAYFYKEYKNGKKVRISKDNYDKLESTTKKCKNKPNTKAKLHTKIMKGGNFTTYFLDSNIERIGGGSYGSVYKYKLKPKNIDVFFSTYPIARTELENKASDEQEVAVKFLYFPEGTTNKVMMRNAQQELSSGQIFLDHPFFIKMYGILKLESEECREFSVKFKKYIKKYVCKFCILMEYFRGNDLWSCMKRDIRLKPHNSNLSLKCVIIYQLLLAVEHMASEKMMHRDLKPENILINMNTLEIKIIDYGFATKETFSSEKSGTLLYTCPQLRKCTNNQSALYNKSAVYNKRVDVWSLGVIIFEILTNRNLFTEEILERSNLNMITISERIKGAPLSNNNRSTLIPKELKDLLKDMLIPFFNNARHPREKHPMHIDNICDPEQPWIKYLDRMIIERYDKVGVVGHLKGLVDYLKETAVAANDAVAANNN